MKKLILVIIFLLLLPFGSQAATIYVDNGSSGCSSPSDTDYDPATRACGSGSDTVYDTIAGGEGGLSCEDTLIVRAGTYNNDRATVDLSGTCTAETLIQCYAGETCTLGSSGNSGGFLIQEDYIRIDGNRTTTSNGFIVTHQPGTCAYNHPGIGVSGSVDNVVIEECNIVDNERYGVKIWSPSTATVQNNYFARNGMAAIEEEGGNLILNNEVVDARDLVNSCSSDADAFRFHGSGSTYRENYIHSFDYANQNGSPHIDAFQTHAAGSTVGSNTIIEHNYVDFYEVICSFAQCSDTGANGNFLMVEDVSNNVTVRYNIFKGYGFLNSDTDDYAYKIYGNTIIGNPGICSENGRTLGSNCWPTALEFRHNSGTDVLKNNIIVEFDGSHNSYVNYTGAGTLDADGNLTYDSDGSANCTGSGDADCKNTNDIYDTDPQLTNLATNFNPLEGSPVINAAVSISGSGNYDNPLASGSVAANWPDNVSTIEKSGSFEEIGAIDYEVAEASKIKGGAKLKGGAIIK